MHTIHYMPSRSRLIAAGGGAVFSSLQTSTRLFLTPSFFFFLLLSSSFFFSFITAPHLTLPHLGKVSILPYPTEYILSPNYAKLCYGRRALCVPLQSLSVFFFFLFFFFLFFLEF